MIHDSGNRKGSVDFSLIRRTLWKWPAFGKKYLCIQRRRVRRPSFHRPWLIAFDPWIIPTLCPIKVFLPSPILETMALTYNFSVAAETQRRKRLGLYRSFDLRVNVILFQMSRHSSRGLDYLFTLSIYCLLSYIFFKEVYSSKST